MKISFDTWNRQETRKITEREHVDVARLVRKARKGYMFKMMAWDEYLEYCQRHNAKAENFEGGYNE